MGRAGARMSAGRVIEARFVVLALVLLGAITTTAWAAARAATPSAAPPREGALTVERIFGDHPIVGKLPSGIRWVGDGSGVSYLQSRGDGENARTVFVVRSVPSGKERIVCIPDTAVVPADLVQSDGDKFQIDSYEWDRGGRRILFSYGGDLFTVERKDGRIRRWTDTNQDENDAGFSPDGMKIAYTRANDLYVLDLERENEIRLTNSGCDSVLNGVLDWVYMEELYTRGDRRAFCWSPDSEGLAFLQLMESQVPRFPLVDWMESNPEPEFQYYPKPGDVNPRARVGIVRADGGDIKWVDTGTSDDSYIPHLSWLGDGSAVAIVRLNRDQDRLALIFADAGTGRASVVFEEKADTWVNVNSLQHYYEKKRQFIWGSERSGHQHLYLYDRDGSLKHEITWGDWEVISLDGVDESKGRVYVTANKKTVLEHHLYEVSDKAGEVRQITSGDGTHSVALSPDFRYFIDRFSNERRPTVVTVRDIKGHELFEIGDQMTPELEKTTRPVPEFLTFKSTSGRDFYCSITKPTAFNPLEKYPVLVYVYGGPHDQVVGRRWSSSSLWHGMMADRGYIVFAMDNRGSSGRGKEWEDTIARKLGQHELEDQIAGVDYLRSLPYVDGERIGIWGWSYGGYMTLMALFKAPDVFKVGAAVAPVTDWRLYDSIYTERYMKLPAENEEGYRDSSPINFVDDFSGRLLLLHGDADDNVHTQNTYQLIQRLIEAGKPFDFVPFPQKDHGISGPTARVHLFTRMTEFFDEHLLRAVAAESSNR
jgi:dipeptidyl-peptidase-4